VLDVVCMGETLVDFLPAESGKRVREVSSWSPAIGGSLANVSVGVARFGGRSALVTVVGADEFGHFLRESLEAEGVEVSHLRQVSAEYLLNERDVDEAFLGRAKVFHWGSNSLHLPEARVAMQRAVEWARGAGRIVSCDPNLRLHAWADPNEARAILDRLLPLCTVVKLSEEEMPFVTGTSDVRGALEYLRGIGVPLPVVTIGEQGAAFLWQGEQVQVPAPRTRVVDTTGAGDGFVSSLLYGLTRRYSDAQALRAATRESLMELITFSCVVGSRVVERLGAVAGLPRAQDVAEHMPADLRPR
jgi:fructokinase